MSKEGGGGHPKLTTLPTNGLKGASEREPTKYPNRVIDPFIHTWFIRDRDDTNHQISASIIGLCEQYCRHTILHYSFCRSCSACCQQCEKRKRKRLLFLLN